MPGDDAAAGTLNAAPAVLRVAAVQAAPAILDLERGLERVADWTARAASEGARLVVFPEAFLPGYPRGLGFGAVVGSRSHEGRDLFAKLWRACPTVPGPALERLGAIAREHGVWLTLGVIERERGTLYCTLLYLDPDGALRHRHRKLKPTGSERLIWGEGDGRGLACLRIDGVTVGGLVCWENYMPLARMALYAQGVQLYLAPTADCRDAWQSTLRHIALEGRCFVIGCNQFVRREDVPAELRDLDRVPGLGEIVCRGGSVVYGPLGERLAGPLFDREGLLVAELDAGQIARGKFDLDVAGHYARPDLFRLYVRGLEAAMAEGSGCVAVPEDEGV